MFKNTTVKRLNTTINDSSKLCDPKRCLVMFSSVYHIITNSILIYLVTKHLNTILYMVAWGIKKNENMKIPFFLSLYKALYILVFRCLVKAKKSLLLPKTDQTQVNTTKHLLTFVCLPMPFVKKV